MKPWEPRIIDGGRSERPGRRVRRRSRRWRLRGIGLMTGGGIALGLAVALIPAARAPADVAAPARLVAAQPSGVRVIDGDTFDYRGMRIRIADIDTPEVNGRCPAETRLAARATRRMRGLLAEGPFELHRPPGGRDADRYGRKLRIVTRGGQSLGDQLVAEGLARTWTGRREPWC